MMKREILGDVVAVQNLRTLDDYLEDCIQVKSKNDETLVTVYIMELENKYNVGIEKDSNRVYVYSSKFNDCYINAIIFIKTMRIAIKYIHQKDEIYHNNETIYIKDIEDFLNKDIWLLCNHWNLYPKREQLHLIEFRTKIIDILKEITIMQDS